MRQTEHYELNQWDLTDRIRMSDFNADNLKIAAALAGLNGQAAGLTTQISGLTSQISGLTTQMGGLATQEALNTAKAALEASGQQLQEKKLQSYSLRGASSDALGFQLNGSRYVLETGALELDKYAAFRLQLSIEDANDGTYYLNPIIQGNVKKGKFMYLGGTTDQAMAILPSLSTTDCLFFPMCQKNAVLGVLVFGKTLGFGAYWSNYYLLNGFALSLASGTLSSTLSVKVDLYGIK